MPPCLSLSRPADSEGWLHAEGADRQRSRRCLLWQLAGERDGRVDIRCRRLWHGVRCSPVSFGQPTVTVCHRERLVTWIG